MAYTTIDNPELFFQTVLYTGNATARSITLDGSEDMQPDWVWCKNRSINANHHLFDSVRGATKDISSNLTNAETTDTAKVTSFNTDGFSLGTNGNVNGNTNNQVAWCWKAGGSASNNTDGGITSSVSVSQDAGFSIATWTGTGSTATIGHGLNAVPKMIITKARSNAYDWYIYHASIGNTKAIYLNLTNAESGASANFWNNTTPTSSVWTAGGNVFNNNYTFVTYAFAEKKGYSKFGSYTGNGNADGTFIYTGFKPALFIIKALASGENWRIFDNKRSTSGFNPIGNSLRPNSSDAEVTGTDQEIDFLSNGVKLRTTSGEINPSGTTFVFMAFAESPFTNSNGVPNNGR